MKRDSPLMVKSYIHNKIVQYLERYIEEVDAQKLDLGLLSGRIQLNNCKLRNTNTLAAFFFECGVELESVYIESVIVNFSAKKIFSDMIDIVATKPILKIKPLDLSVVNIHNYFLYQRKKHIEKILAKDSSLGGIFGSILDKIVLKVIDAQIIVTSDHNFIHLDGTHPKHEKSAPAGPEHVPNRVQGNSTALGNSSGNKNMTNQDVKAKFSGITDSVNVDKPPSLPKPTLKTLQLSIRSVSLENEYNYDTLYKNLRMDDIRITLNKFEVFYQKLSNFKIFYDSRNNLNIQTTSDELLLRCNEFLLEFLWFCYQKRILIESTQRFFSNNLKNIADPSNLPDLFLNLSPIEKFRGFVKFLMNNSSVLVSDSMIREEPSMAYERNPRLCTESSFIYNDSIATNPRSRESVRGVQDPETEVQSPTTTDFHEPESKSNIDELSANSDNFQDKTSSKSNGDPLDPESNPINRNQCFPPTHLTLDEIHSKLDKVSRYRDLYEKLSESNLSPTELTEFETIQENFTVHEISYHRKMAIKIKHLRPKRRFFFFQTAVTEEERARILDELEVVEIQVPKNYNFKLNISQLTIDISILQQRYSLVLRNNSIDLSDSLTAQIGRSFATFNDLNILESRDACNAVVLQKTHDSINLHLGPISTFDILSCLIFFENILQVLTQIMAHHKITFTQRCYCEDIYRLEQFVKTRGTRLLGPSGSQALQTTSFPCGTAQRASENTSKPDHESLHMAKSSSTKCSNSISGSLTHGTTTLPGSIHQSASENTSNTDPGVYNTLKTHLQSSQHALKRCIHCRVDSVKEVETKIGILIDKIKANFLNTYLKIGTAEIFGTTRHFFSKIQDFCSYIAPTKSDNVEPTDETVLRRDMYVYSTEAAQKGLNISRQDQTECSRESKPLEYFRDHESEKQTLQTANTIDCLMKGYRSEDDDASDTTSMHVSDFDQYFVHSLYIPSAKPKEIVSKTIITIETKMLPDVVENTVQVGLLSIKPLVFFRYANILGIFIHFDRIQSRLNAINAVISEMTGMSFQDEIIHILRRQQYKNVSGHGISENGVFSGNQAHLQLEIAQMYPIVEGPCDKKDVNRFDSLLGPEIENQSAPSKSLQSISDAGNVHGPADHIHDVPGPVIENRSKVGELQQTNSDISNAQKQESAGVISKTSLDTRYGRDGFCFDTRSHRVADYLSYSSETHRRRIVTMIKFQKMDLKEPSISLDKTRIRLGSHTRVEIDLLKYNTILLTNLVLEMRENSVNIDRPSLDVVLENVDLGTLFRDLKSINEIVEYLEKIKERAYRHTSSMEVNGKNNSQVVPEGSQSYVNACSTSKTRKERYTDPIHGLQPITQHSNHILDPQTELICPVSTSNHTPQIHQSSSLDIHFMMKISDSRISITLNGTKHSFTISNIISHQGCLVLSEIRAYIESHILNVSLLHFMNNKVTVFGITLRTDTNLYKISDQFLNFFIKAGLLPLGDEKRDFAFSVKLIDTDCVFYNRSLMSPICLHANFLEINLPLDLISLDTDLRVSNISKMQPSTPKQFQDICAAKSSKLEIFLGAYFQSSSVDVHMAVRNLTASGVSFSDIFDLLVLNVDEFPDQLSNLPNHGSEKTAEASSDNVVPNSGENQTNLYTDQTSSYQHDRQSPKPINVAKKQTNFCTNQGKSRQNDRRLPKTSNVCNHPNVFPNQPQLHQNDNGFYLETSNSDSHPNVVPSRPHLSQNHSDSVIYPCNCSCIIQKHLPDHKSRDIVNTHSLVLNSIRKRSGLSHSTRNLVQISFLVEKRNEDLNLIIEGKGNVDNEFYRTIIHCALSMLDLVTAITSKVFPQNPNNTFLHSKITLDVDLYNHCNDEFLSRIVAKNILINGDLCLFHTENDFCTSENTVRMFKNDSPQTIRRIYEGLLETIQRKVNGSFSYFGKLVNVPEFIITEDRKIREVKSPMEGLAPLGISYYNDTFTSEVGSHSISNTPDQSEKVANYSGYRETTPGNTAAKITSSQGVTRDDVTDSQTIFRSLSHDSTVQNIQPQGVTSDDVTDSQTIFRSLSNDSTIRNIQPQGVATTKSIFPQGVIWDNNSLDHPESRTINHDADLRTPLEGQSGTGVDPRKHLVSSQHHSTSNPKYFSTSLNDTGSRFANSPSSPRGTSKVRCDVTCNNGRSPQFEKFDIVSGSSIKKHLEALRVNRSNEEAETLRDIDTKRVTNGLTTQRQTTDGNNPGGIHSENTPSVVDPSPKNSGSTAHGYNPGGIYSENTRSVVNNLPKNSGPTAHSYNPGGIHSENTRSVLRNSLTKRPTAHSNKSADVNAFFDPTGHILTYKKFSIVINHAIIASRSNNIEGIVSGLNIFIYKNFKELYARVLIDSVHATLPVHKALMLKHGYITPNLDFGNNDSLPVKVRLDIDRVSYKNFVINNFCLNDAISFVLSFLSSRVSDFGSFCFDEAVNALKIQYEKRPSIEDRNMRSLERLFRDSEVAQKDSEGVMSSERYFRCNRNSQDFETHPFKFSPVKSGNRTDSKDFPKDTNRNGKCSESSKQNSRTGSKNIQNDSNGNGKWGQSDKQNSPTDSKNIPNDSNGTGKWGQSDKQNSRTDSKNIQNDSEGFNQCDKSIGYVNQTYFKDRTADTKHRHLPKTSLSTHNIDIPLKQGTKNPESTQHLINNAQTSETINELVNPCNVQILIDNADFYTLFTVIIDKVSLRDSSTLSFLKKVFDDLIIEKTLFQQNCVFYEFKEVFFNLKLIEFALEVSSRYVLHLESTNLTNFPADYLTEMSRVYMKDISKIYAAHSSVDCLSDDTNVSNDSGHAPSTRNIDQLDRKIDGTEKISAVRNIHTEGDFGRYVDPLHPNLCIDGFSNMEQNPVSGRYSDPLHSNLCIDGLSNMERNSVVIEHDGLEYIYRNTPNNCSERPTNPNSENDKLPEGVFAKNRPTSKPSQLLKAVDSAQSIHGNSKNKRHLEGVFTKNSPNSKPSQLSEAVDRQAVYGKATVKCTLREKCLLEPSKLLLTIKDESISVKFRRKTRFKLDPSIRETGASQRAVFLNYTSKNMFLMYNNERYSNQQDFVVNASDKKIRLEIHETSRDSETDYESTNNGKMGYESTNNRRIGYESTTSGIPFDSETESENTRLGSNATIFGRGRNENFLVAEEGETTVLLQGSVYIVRCSLKGHVLVIQIFGNVCFNNLTNQKFDVMIGTGVMFLGFVTLQPHSSTYLDNIDEVCEQTRLECDRIMTEGMIMTKGEIMIDDRIMTDGRFNNRQRAGTPISANLGHKGGKFSSKKFSSTSGQETADCERSQNNSHRDKDPTGNVNNTQCELGQEDLSRCLYDPQMPNFSFFYSIMLRQENNQDFLERICPDSENIADISASKKCDQKLFKQKVSAINSHNSIFDSREGIPESPHSEKCRTDFSGRPFEPQIDVINQSTVQNRKTDTLQFKCRTASEDQVSSRENSPEHDLEGTENRQELSNPFKEYLTDFFRYEKAWHNSQHMQTSTDTNLYMAVYSETTNEKMFFYDGTNTCHDEKEYLKCINTQCFYLKDLRVNCDLVVSQKNLLRTFYAIFCPTAYFYNATNDNLEFELCNLSVDRSESFEIMSGFVREIARPYTESEKMIIKYDKTACGFVKKKSNNSNGSTDATGIMSSMGPKSPLTSVKSRSNDSKGSSNRTDTFNELRNTHISCFSDHSETIIMKIRDNPGFTYSSQDTSRIPEKITVKGICRTSGILSQKDYQLSQHDSFVADQRFGQSVHEITNNRNVVLDRNVRSLDSVQDSDTGKYVNEVTNTRDIISDGKDGLLNLAPTELRHGFMHRFIDIEILGAKYTTNVIEMIAYPLYIIQNVTKSVISLDNFHIEKGETHSDIPFRKSKITMDGLHKSKKRLNYGSLEIFDVLYMKNKLSKKLKGQFILQPLRKHVTMNEIVPSSDYFKEKRIEDILFANDIQLYYKFAEIFYGYLRKETLDSTGRYADRFREKGYTYCLKTSDLPSDNILDEKLAQEFCELCNSRIKSLEPECTLREYHSEDKRHEDLLDGKFTQVGSEYCKNCKTNNDPGCALRELHYDDERGENISYGNFSQKGCEFGSSENRNRLNENTQQKSFDEVKGRRSANRTVQLSQKCLHGETRHQMADAATKEKAKEDSKFAGRTKSVIDFPYSEINHSSLDKSGPSASNMKIHEGICLTAFKHLYSSYLNDPRRLKIGNENKIGLITTNIPKYKNLAVEMRLCRGRFEKTRILRFQDANILINNTQYTFLVISYGVITILKPQDICDIHFGSDPFFHIMFCDEYGAESQFDLLNFSGANNSAGSNESEGTTKSQNNGLTERRFDEWNFSGSNDSAGPNGSKKATKSRNNGLTQSRFDEFDFSGSDDQIQLDQSNGSSKNVTNLRTPKELRPAEQHPDRLSPESIAHDRDLIHEQSGNISQTSQFTENDCIFCRSDGTEKSCHYAESLNPIVNSQITVTLRENGSKDLENTLQIETKVNDERSETSLKPRVFIQPRDLSRNANVSYNHNNIQNYESGSENQHSLSASKKHDSCGDKTSKRPERNSWTQDTVVESHRLYGSSEPESNKFSENKTSEGPAVNSQTREHSTEPNKLNGSSKPESNSISENKTSEWPASDSQTREHSTEPNKLNGSSKPDSYYIYENKTSEGPTVSSQTREHPTEPKFSHESSKSEISTSHFPKFKDYISHLIGEKRKELDDLLIEHVSALPDLQYTYFEFESKLYRIPFTEKISQSKCAIIEVSGIRSVLFSLKRTDFVFFEVRLKLDNKQRIIEIFESEHWPYIIQNDLMVPVKFKYKPLDIEEIIEPKNRYNFCPIDGSSSLVVFEHEKQSMEHRVRLTKKKEDLKYFENTWQDLICGTSSKQTTVQPELKAKMRESQVAKRSKNLLKHDDGFEYVYRNPPTDHCNDLSCTKSTQKIQNHLTVQNGNLRASVCKYPDITSLSDQDRSHRGNTSVDVCGLAGKGRNLHNDQDLSYRCNNEHTSVDEKVLPGEYKHVHKMNPRKLKPSNEPVSSIAPEKPRAGCRIGSNSKYIVKNLRCILINSRNGTFLETVAGFMVCNTCSEPLILRKKSFRKFFRNFPSSTSESVYMPNSLHDDPKNRSEPEQSEIFQTSLNFNGSQGGPRHEAQKIHSDESEGNQPTLFDTSYNMNQGELWCEAEKIHSDVSEGNQPTLFDTNSNINQGRLFKKIYSDPLANNQSRIAAPNQRVETAILPLKHQSRTQDGKANLSEVVSSENNSQILGSGQSALLVDTQTVLGRNFKLNEQSSPRIARNHPNICDIAGREPRKHAVLSNFQSDTTNTYPVQPEMFKNQNQSQTDILSTSSFDSASNETQFYYGNDSGSEPNVWTALSPKFKAASKLHRKDNIIGPGDASNHPKTGLSKFIRRLNIHGKTIPGNDKKISKIKLSVQEKMLRPDQYLITVRDKSRKKAFLTEKVPAATFQNSKNTSRSMRHAQQDSESSMMHKTQSKSMQNLKNAGWSTDNQVLHSLTHVKDPGARDSQLKITHSPQSKVYQTPSEIRNTAQGTKPKSQTMCYEKKNEKPAAVSEQALDSEVSPSDLSIIESTNNPPPENKSMNIHLDIPEVSISFCDTEEIATLHLKHVTFRIIQNTNIPVDAYKMFLGISRMQLDDQTIDTRLPVMIQPERLVYNDLKPENLIKDYFLKVGFEITKMNEKVYKDPFNRGFKPGKSKKYFERSNKIRYGDLKMNEKVNNDSVDQEFARGERSNNYCCFEKLNTDSLAVKDDSSRSNDHSNVDTFSPEIQACYESEEDVQQNYTRPAQKYDSFTTMPPLEEKNLGISLDADHIDSHSQTPVTDLRNVQKHESQCFVRSQDDPEANLKFTVTRESSNNGGTLIHDFCDSWKIDAFHAKAAPFFLRIDENTVLRLKNAFIGSTGISKAYSCHICGMKTCTCLDRKFQGVPILRIESLVVSAAEVLLSVRTQRGGVRGAALSYVADALSDVRVDLPAQRYRRLAVAPTGLLATMAGNYRAAVMRQAFALVGAVDALGNAQSFAAAFAAGCCELASAVDSGGTPVQRIARMGRGLRGFSRNAISGVSGSVARVSAAISHNAALCSLDSAFKSRPTSTASYAVDKNLSMPGAPSITPGARPALWGARRLFSSVGSGLSGLLVRPATAMREGPGRAFAALSRGLVGIVAKPVSGVADFASGLADSISQSVHATQAFRLEYPRFNIAENYDEDANRCSYVFRSIKKQDIFIYGETVGKKHVIACVKNLYIVSKNRVSEYEYKDCSLDGNILKVWEKVYRLNERLASIIRRKIRERY